MEDSLAIASQSARVASSRPIEDLSLGYGLFLTPLFLYLASILIAIRTEPLSITDELVTRFPDGVLPVSQWTGLSSDDKYLSHILYLFFTWDQTLSHIVPRTVFLEDLKAGPTKTTKFCSRFLVHCLIAVSHVS